MKLLKSLAVAAALSTTVPAHALVTLTNLNATGSFGVLGTDPQQGLGHIVASVGSVFSHFYTFQLTEAFSVGVSAVEIELGTRVNFDNGTLALFSGLPSGGSQIGASYTVDGSTGNQTRSFESLATGNYYFQIGGVVAPGASKASYTILASAAPVPEPHEWMMMLAGLGLVGWASTRAKRASPPALAAV
jgi:hypothetical protein